MRILSIFLLVALVASTSPGYAQSSAIPWSTFSGGFGVGSSGSLRVASAVGQPFVGVSSAGGRTVKSGFLAYPFVPPLSSGIPGSEEHGIPTVYDLSQNYPNPFNPSTTIRFALPRASIVRLTVYNVLGQEVAMLADEVRPAGYHAVIWNGTNRKGNTVSSGMYIVRIVAQEVGGQSSFTGLKKMILVK